MKVSAYADGFDNAHCVGYPLQSAFADSFPKGKPLVIMIIDRRNA